MVITDDNKTLETDEEDEEEMEVSLDVLFCLYRVLGWSVSTFAVTSVFRMHICSRPG